MNTPRHLKLAGLITETEKKFNITLPPEIEIIHNAFKRDARKLYIVGGSVRDSLLGIEPKDFDLVTDAEPKAVMNLLKKAGIKSIPIGEQFGVVAAVINNEMFEIATFRKDDETIGFNADNFIRYLSEKNINKNKIENFKNNLMK